MRNEAPLADFEGRESAEERSFSIFSLTRSAWVLDIAKTRLRFEMWKLTLREEKKSCKGEWSRTVQLACRAFKIVLNEPYCYLIVLSIHLSYK